MLVLGSKMQNWLDEYKTIFLGKQGKLETSPKFSPYIGVSYKFILKPVKSVKKKNWFSSLSKISVYCDNFFSNFLNIQHSTVEYSAGDNI